MLASSETLVPREKKRLMKSGAFWKSYFFYFLFISLVNLGIFACRSSGEGFQSSWPILSDRTWAGPDFWANRLQDWRAVRGRLVCLENSSRKPMRTVHLLTRRLGEKNGRFTLRVRAGIFGAASSLPSDAAVGFLIGAGGQMDYRAAALIHHSPGKGGGLFAGIDGEGRLFIRDFGEESKVLAATEAAGGLTGDVMLKLSGRVKDGKTDLTVTASSKQTGKKIGLLSLSGLEPRRLVGNMALVSHPGSKDPGGRFWFRDWRVEGSKIEVYPDRHCGPILSVQYTLSKRVLKLTAQFMPLGTYDNDEALLELRRDGSWETLARTRVLKSSHTASFRLENWDDTRDTQYRVRYRYRLSPEEEIDFSRSGIIRRNPVDREEFVLAAFTGNHNSMGAVEEASFSWEDGLWFPHSDLIRHVTSHKPDLFFFSGDQVYEGASPTEPDFIHPGLDYLYKWYLWCWAFRDLTADYPAVIIPDDHDVFQGNLWGAGGRATREGTSGIEAQDSGGYRLPPQWVNLVQRTQTSHLPDPFDATPAAQGIDVYYCALHYGGVSFAVLEDRKFKSAPQPLLPRAEIWNGWPQSEDFDPKKDADVPEATLLGERQLRFLDEWAADWSEGTWMKAVLSQTLLANVATLPATSSRDDRAIQILPIPEPGEYPENEVPVADMDSNGWPQTGRNQAIRAMRKGFAVHICGDQHLGSTIQYGVEDWRDAGYALCVPSIANFWPRRWFPPEAGKNSLAGSSPYTGDYEDGFGNKMTVLAVANPVRVLIKPERLNNRAPGYGIARFLRSTREIVFENWPRWVDPLEEGAEPYPGWPVYLRQEDNYNRKSSSFLPVLNVKGMENPVVQVISEDTGEILYTIRISGREYRPKVFAPGRYMVRIGELGTESSRVLKNINADMQKDEREMVIEF